jgi:hypothetical protein
MSNTGTPPALHSYFIELTTGQKTDGWSTIPEVAQYEKLSFSLAYYDTTKPTEDGSFQINHLELIAESEAEYALWVKALTDMIRLTKQVTVTMRPPEIQVEPFTFSAGVVSPDLCSYSFWSACSLASV